MYRAARDWEAPQSHQSSGVRQSAERIANPRVGAAIGSTGSSVVGEAG